MSDHIVVGLNLRTGESRFISPEKEKLADEILAETAKAFDKAFDEICKATPEGYILGIDRVYALYLDYMQALAAD